MNRLIIAALLTFFLKSSILLAQILPVSEVVQEQSQWCWAAVSKCILNYYGTAAEQCEIAEYTRTIATWHNYGTTDCCVDPSQGCNYTNSCYTQVGSIADILKYFGNINNYGCSSAISENDIEVELNNSRPFVIRWGWYSGGGHFIVGHGKDNQTIYFMDPLYGEGLKFADYNWVIDNGIHKWTHTDVLTTDPTGIFNSEAKTKTEIIIAPNPSSGDITIRLGSEINKDIQIEVINSSGQVVYYKDYKTILPKMQLSLNFPKGVYIAKVTGTHFIKTEKIIVN